jgi:hypothetical protein
MPPSSLFGPGNPYRNTHRPAAEVQRDQDNARREDTARQSAANAAGPGRRSIGSSGR